MCVCGVCVCGGSGLNLVVAGSQQEGVHVFLLLLCAVAGSFVVFTNLNIAP